jgi:hypothetical protein
MDNVRLSVIGSSNWIALSRSYIYIFIYNIS